ncbi:MAG: tRNA (guanosine(46)-N7)-methyltransferase TrmB [Bacteroidales bacterium]|jgi:tRNA (guanine-N7-)-methyltransferase|nr:tRNA (guanosine(46)-N7)-methyltransferase TrmB [Bacteroidales bacterium]
MSKNKLTKFAENETFPNLFQRSADEHGNEQFPLRGRWRQDYFKNDNPIIVELGCGKGDYTVALAERFPMENYIGIDRKGARLWRGCKTAIEKSLHNVAFLRIGIDRIDAYFGPEEVDEFWITFPDPQPKKERRRLTSPNFIQRYKEVLKPDGMINLKTDSREFYQYTLDTIRKQGWALLVNIENVYQPPCDPILTDIQTFYEKMWLREGRMISYVRFGSNILSSSPYPHYYQKREVE